LCDLILDTPIVTNEVPFLLVWIVIPYAFDIHGNNPDAVKETVKETSKQYLSQIHRVKPLLINPSKLNRLIHLIVQRNLAEYQELGCKFFIRPTSMATLRKQFPQLYRDIINALASNNSNNSSNTRKETIEELMSEVERLGSQIPVGDP
jgi:hypothetical protein